MIGVLLTIDGCVQCSIIGNMMVKTTLKYNVYQARSKKGDRFSVPVV